MAKALRPSVPSTPSRAKKTRVATRPSRREVEPRRLSSETEPHRISERSERGPAAGSGLIALAPAANHLLRAVSEVIAAAQSAFDALPVETRARSRWSLRSARVALDLVGRLARSGAERTRRQARANLRAETAREILAALDARASRLDPRSAAALDAVRGAVADALGAEPPLAPRSPKLAARPAPRRLRRIPPVSFDAESDAGDESWQHRAHT